MGSLMKMLACHCILLVTILLSTCSSAPSAAAGNDTVQNPTTLGTTTEPKPVESNAEFTTFPDLTTDLPSTTETIQPKGTTTFTTSTETPAAEVEASTKKQLTTSGTTSVKTTQENDSTSKILTPERQPPVTTNKSETTETPDKTTKPENSGSTTKPENLGSTTKPENLGSTTEHADPLTVPKADSSETSSIESGSTKDTSTGSSILGVNKNSFTAKVILPIAAGIILAVFIVLIVCSIRSCVDRKDRNSSRRRTMDHDMAPMDRVMLLADSSEDEF